MSLRRAVTQPSGQWIALLAQALALVRYNKPGAIHIGTQHHYTVEAVGEGGYLVLKGPIDDYRQVATYHQNLQRRLACAHTEGRLVGVYEAWLAALQQHFHLVQRPKVCMLLSTVAVKEQKPEIVFETVSLDVRWMKDAAGHHQVTLDHDRRRLHLRECDASVRRTARAVCRLLIRGSAQLPLSSVFHPSGTPW